MPVNRANSAPVSVCVGAGAERPDGGAVAAGASARPSSAETVPPTAPATTTGAGTGTGGCTAARARPADAAPGPPPPGRVHTRCGRWTVASATISLMRPRGSAPLKYWPTRPVQVHRGTDVEHFRGARPAEQIDPWRERRHSSREHTFAPLHRRDVGEIRGAARSNCGCLGCRPVPSDRAAHPRWPGRHRVRGASGGVPERNSRANSDSRTLGASSRVSTRRANRTVHSTTGGFGQARSALGGSRFGGSRCRKPALWATSTAPRQNCRNIGNTGGDGWGVAHHCGGDPGQLHDLRWDAATRINERGKLSEHHSAPHLYRADLGDGVGIGRPPSRVVARPPVVSRSTTTNVVSRSARVRPMSRSPRSSTVRRGCRSHRVTLGRWHRHPAVTAIPLRVATHACSATCRGGRSSVPVLQAPDQK